MERCAIFMNWTIQYSKDVNSPQSPYIGFTQFLLRFQQDYFVRIDQVFLKCTSLWKGRRTRLAETILKNRNKVGGISPSNFKIYVATVIETVWY